MSLQFTYQTLPSLHCCNKNWCCTPSLLSWAIIISTWNFRLLLFEIPEFNTRKKNLSYNPSSLFNLNRAICQEPFFPFSNVFRPTLTSSLQGLLSFYDQELLQRYHSFQCLLPASASGSSSFFHLLSSHGALFNWRQFLMKFIKDLDFFCSENISIFVPCMVTSIFHIWPGLVPIMFSGKILL